ncbi:MAG: zinc metalloprotease HtpX [Acidobacteria bacterium]|jgi:heat shock protein HtpX|nr:zinc metalloprotease HtpX [Acidobacteriota bacterium]
MNNFKTVILLGALTGIFLFIGGAVGGQGGMIIALIFAGIMNLVSYWFSDSIVLRSYGAQPLGESEAPEIHRMIDELCMNARIPKPRVYFINEDSPNAFATGRNPQHGAIVLSTGIMKLMSRDELKGVIAHELSHIRHRDTLIQSVAATVGGAIMFLAYQMRWFALFTGGGGRDDDDRGGIFGLLAMAILAPIAAFLIQMAISRSREYIADQGAAELSHSPYGLASALEKLGTYSKRIPMEASQQTAHLFIVSPLSGKGFASIFSTHPPLEERIARLRAMRLG